jgi:hypothetical protein
MLATEPSEPAAVAALLRRRIAEHDQDRRTRQALIRALEDYAYQLKVENMTAAAIIGRLRRMAADHDVDADRLRRQRLLGRVTYNNQTELARAA